MTCTHTADCQLFPQFAAELGNLGMVNLLLELGCNPHAKNNGGLKAAQIAADNDHEECVQAIKIAMQNTPESNAVYPVAAQEPENMAYVLRFLRRFNPFKKAS